MKRLTIGFVMALVCTMIVISISIINLFSSSDDRGEEMNKEGESRVVNAVNKKTSPLSGKLDDYIQQESILDGSLIGISIRSAETGELLYDHFGNIRMRPASNMKLITAVAALDTLGGDYTFKTEILTEGSITDGVLDGNLYLKGKGDPTLLASDFADFAKQLQKKGINKIEGNIIADDTWYDDERLSPDLIWSDEQWYYGAQVSALTASPDQDYDAGTVVVTIRPNTVGEAPTVSVSPTTDYITIENNATTSEQNREEDLTIERQHGTNIIRIDGTIPTGSTPIKEWMAVWEPTMYAMNLFQEALKNEGITWTGDKQSGKTPEDAKLLHAHDSMPLSDLLVPFMKVSNNGHAEILIKEMGKVEKGEGTWEKGLEVVEEVLSQLEIDTETMVLRDGSGISHMNLIPANVFSELLYTIQDKDWFSTYLNALPEAGEADRMVGGTLRNRMHEHSVQAKTGTIYGVSTLSGYVDTKSEGRLTFSILLNNLIDEDQGPSIEDELVNIIATQ
ncbi:D-alanyl-D-alanine carboxypeptidase/D-alanyl-D-alanine endopeptidase [Oceanobacillus halotolerans]|uniref:D-alanyl-D-alanine carboxypeptidase/D-alanyl-D-alanine endopeptidase n=1 Tax=Oceanobacillus halotolerans TaxID=2663380 RepID=UPI0013DB6971|nr:D-alanyl-D-alanine carboxypeptidase/D-alanyl-D-alanine-endopeptidase [Oceanobacillus halotolerans]